MSTRIAGRAYIVNNVVQYQSGVGVDFVEVVGLYEIVNFVCVRVSKTLMKAFELCIGEKALPQRIP